MPSTIAADRLEYVLDEMRDAIEDIEGRAGRLHESPDVLNDVLLSALKKARAILEDAQTIAEENGVPRLSVFGS